MKAKMEKQQREQRNKESIKWVGKSIRETRKVMQQAAKARKEARHRPYHLWPDQKLFMKFKDTKNLVSC